MKKAMKRLRSSGLDIEQCFTMQGFTHTSASYDPIKCTELLLVSDICLWKQYVSQSDTPVSAPSLVRTEPLSTGIGSGVTFGSLILSY